MATIHSPGNCPRRAGRGLYLVPPVAGQRQGPFSDTFCRPDWTAAAAGLATAETAGHYLVHAQRRARRPVHAVPYVRGITRRGGRACLARPVAGRARGILRVARRW